MGMDVWHDRVKKKKKKTKRSRQENKTKEELFVMWSERQREDVQDNSYKLSLYERIFCVSVFFFRLSIFIYIE